MLTPKLVALGRELPSGTGYNPTMGQVTQLLQKIEQGNSSASAELLPLVYEELRSLAARKLAKERNTSSLQPTLLVHEAYLRLVDAEQQTEWNSRGHFFGAAAEAMRRILVEQARRRKTLKRGANHHQVPIEFAEPVVEDKAVDLLSLDEALTQFESLWPNQARLVKLRYFAGLTIAQAAQAMQISESTAERYWTFARTWLFSKLSD
jgi:RNA polymerase sigma factor (TIGR02999 family)